jgi:hypothetical protein
MTESPEVNIHVTDHAIVQFLSRTGQIDVHAVKRRILDDKTLSMAQKLGDGVYPIGDDLAAIIRDRAVITVQINSARSFRTALSDPALRREKN